ncbi:hypothetical protein KGV55_01120 [Candidatus Gracilibacteria bacterium]|nr:hypothetical protein [Candidatus Gracilibacteria bacterium]
MSLFDDLLNKGEKTQGQDPVAQSDEQTTASQAGITTSTNADDIIITPESGGFIDTGSILTTEQGTSENPTSTAVPNMIVTETPNIVINEETTQITEENAPANTIAPQESENIPTISLDANIQNIETPQTANIKIESPLAPIQGENATEILGANTPVPVASVEELNAPAPIMENPVIEMSSPTQAESSLITETPTQSETGGLFGLDDTDTVEEKKEEAKTEETSDNISSGLFAADASKKSETKNIDTTNETLDFSLGGENLLENKKETATLDSFIASSLENIQSLLKTQAQKKEDEKNKGAEMKAKKEEYAQKEQDAYDAIKQIETNIAQTKRMETYLKKQLENKKAKGSVKTGLAEIATKEAVKKVVSGRKKTTRARKTTARKTTTRRRKTTTKVA